MSIEPDLEKPGRVGRELLVDQPVVPHAGGQRAFPHLDAALGRGVVITGDIKSVAGAREVLDVEPVRRDAVEREAVVLLKHQEVRYRREIIRHIHAERLPDGIAGLEETLYVTGRSRIVGRRARGHVGVEHGDRDRVPSHPGDRCSGWSIGIGVHSHTRHPGRRVAGIEHGPSRPDPVLEMRVVDQPAARGLGRPRDRGAHPDHHGVGLAFERGDESEGARCRARLVDAGSGNGPALGDPAHHGWTNCSVTPGSGSGEVLSGSGQKRCRSGGDCHAGEGRRRWRRGRILGRAGRGRDERSREG